MPKYLVVLERHAVEQAEIEVEADDEDSAVDIAMQIHGNALFFAVASDDDDEPYLWSIDEIEDETE